MHFEDGWGTLRPQVFNRQLATGGIDGSFTLSPKGDHPDGGWPGLGNPLDWGTSRAGNPIDDWNTLSSTQRADLARRMACYAASVEQVDENIGKVVTRLTQLGQLDNTLILLCSDNGANDEGGEFHFAWLRRLDAAETGVTYTFRFSTDLQSWTEFTPDELSALLNGADHEVVQARVPAAVLDDPLMPGQPRKRVFIRIEAGT